MRIKNSADEKKVHCSVTPLRFLNAKNVHHPLGIHYWIIAILGNNIMDELRSLIRRRVRESNTGRNTVMWS